MKSAKVRHKCAMAHYPSKSAKSATPLEGWRTGGEGDQ